MKDPYETLGVERNADAREVKRAYRRKISKAHPDRAGGNAEQATEITTAYGILANPERREHYDRTGQDRGAPRNAVEDELMRLFAQLLEHMDLIDGDVIVHAGKLVARRLAKVESSLADATKMRERLKKSRGRIIAAKKNLMELLLAQRIQDADHSIALLQIEIETMNGVMAALQEYRDTAPSLKEMVTVQWVTPNNGVTTTI